MRLGAEQWLDALKEWVSEEEVLFVLSDEADRTWFAPLERYFRGVFYLTDFEAELEGLSDPNMRGMVEQLVAAAPPCRSFTGTFFSTFSSHPRRRRNLFLDEARSAALDRRASSSVRPSQRQCQRFIVLSRRYVARLRASPRPGGNGDLASRDPSRGRRQQSDARSL